MSISLPNGTLLATPAQQTQYTAAVTRILHLSEFPAELKTRDLQLMFKDHEADKGGFRIKWVDDTNALVVFADAGVAKRAYLSFLLSPPSAFPPPAQIKPYDKPDAAQIIQALSARAMGHRASMSSFNQAPMAGGALGGGMNGMNGIVEGLPGVGSHHRGGSMSKSQGQGQAGPSGWTFPRPAAQGQGPTGGISGSSLVNGTAGSSGAAGIGGSGAGAGRHGRTGSASSFSLSRQPLGGLGGALNFASSSSSSSNTAGIGSRLPTHIESPYSPAISAGTNTGTRMLTGRHGFAAGGSLAGGGGGGAGGGIGGTGTGGQNRTGAGGPPGLSSSISNEHTHQIPRPHSSTSARSAGSRSATATDRSGASSDTEGPIVVMDHAPTPEPGAVAGAGGVGSAEASALLGGSGAEVHSTNGRGRVPFGQWKMPSNPSSKSTSPTPPSAPTSASARRDSVSAEKALREVQKALASVEGSAP